MNDQSSSSHPLKAIARKFEARERRPIQPGKRPTTGPASDSGPSLSPKDIKSPAVLIDSSLHILWQNQAALTYLWRQPEATESGSEIHLFDMLFNSSFRDLVTNWKDWVIFFVQQVRPFVNDIQTLIEQRDEAEREMLIPLLNDSEATFGAGAQVNCVKMMLADTSNKINFSVVGTTFDKGRLLVFEMQDVWPQADARTAELHQRFAMMHSQSAPVKKTFYAMSVRLNRANALKAEMLDEDYSRLMHRIWGQAIETIEQSGGIVTQYSSDGINGSFLPSEISEPNPLFVIQCALALKTQMAELGREWKIRRGWLHDIELNIGIEAGSEYMMMLPTLFGENLIPSGDAVQVAACLAQVAANGQIWATKALISQVPANDLKNIHFGIFRDENNHKIFIAKSFLRIRELPGVDGRFIDIHEDYGVRSVTQIFDRTLQA